jgi:hypothetical protein
LYGILCRSGGPYNTEFVTEGAPLGLPRGALLAIIVHPLTP